MNLLKVLVYVIVLFLLESSLVIQSHHFQDQQAQDFILEVELLTFLELVTAYFLETAFNSNFTMIEDEQPQDLRLENYLINLPYLKQTNFLMQTLNVSYFSIHASFL